VAPSAQKDGQALCGPCQRITGGQIGDQLGSRGPREDHQVMLRIFEITWTWLTAVQNKGGRGN
jgi:hypothetical protein